MPRTVIFTHHYAATPQNVWNIAIDYACLHEVMQGVVSFTGLPQGRVTKGQKINVEVSLFGKLPKQPYFMEIIDCNSENMMFKSSERGAGVISWFHTLTVEPSENGCTLTDNIEIDAGLFTPLFTLWARYLYKARHKPRLKILARRGQLKT